MRTQRLTTLLPIISLLVNVPYTLSSCPLLGSSFPTPKTLSTNSIFQTALSNLTTTLQQVIATSNSSHGPVDSNQTAWSIQVFSTYNQSLFQFHNTALSLANSTNGTRSVDPNSVYRIGSVSKLFTVLLFLIETGDGRWNDPVTKYIPELQKAEFIDPLQSISWSEVTLGSLASHLSGITRDYGFADLARDPPSRIPAVFPQLNASEIPLCGISQVGNASIESCTREDYLKGLIGTHPIFPVYTTPAYSNTGFVLLGLVLESITGKNVSSILQGDLIDRLQLNGTSYTIPSDWSQGVIPGDPNAVGWDLDIGIEGPAGGFFSTTSDLSKIGQAILNSTLLSPTVTRRWMKPDSLTSNPALAVGKPWEIIRYSNPNEDNRIIDTYTKGGNVGLYATAFILIPDYDVGIVVLAGGVLSSLDGTTLAGIVADGIIPALEDTARQEADGIFAGTYTSSNQSINSTIILTTESTEPGLKVSTWVNNGTDVFQSFTQSVFGTVVPTVLHLIPTGLTAGNSIGFRGVLETNLGLTDTGPFSESCFTWASVDGYNYGSVGFDDWVITIGTDGKAASVEPRVLREVLVRS